MRETEPESKKGRNVSVATMAFGSRCFLMMVASESPSARAAVIYSKLRPRRNSARTRPTSDVQWKSNSTPSSVQKPGTSTDEIMSST